MTGRKRLVALVVLPALLVSLGSCDEADLTSVHVRLEADGSGTIRLSTVSVPEDGILEAGAAVGMTWSHQVRLEAADGQFGDIAAVRLGDLVFHRAVSPRGIGQLEIDVPVGPSAAWITILAPMTPAQRTETAQAFDESGRTAALGRAVKIQIELPADVIASELVEYVTDLATGRKRNVATLVVPLEGLPEDVSSVTWLVTWKQPA